MPLEAAPAQSLGNRLTGIIWGDVKTGKTTWAMSLPGRKLLVNFDPDGFISVAYRDDVDVLDLSQLPHHDALEQGKKVAAYIKENADKYTSVVTDSLTTLTEMALYNAVDMKVGASPKFTPTLDAPGLSAYGGRNNRVNDICGRILRATAQHGMHCFFITHLDDPERDQDGKHIIQQTMMLPGKIRGMQGIKMSEVYYIEKGHGDKRVVRFSPHGHLRPMGSRIIDTEKVQKIDLKYSIDKPDAEQNHALCNVIKRWQDGGMVKLTSIPS